MSELLRELKADFASNDKDYRHAYADENLNVSIATQIKVLREQRDLTQQALAVTAEMKQPMISRYENANYSSWSISTLKKLAIAFDVWLDVRFRSFGEFVATVDGFSREALQVPRFEDDAFFRDVPAVATADVTTTYGTRPLTNGLLQSTVNAFVSTAEPSTTDAYATKEWWERWSRAYRSDLTNSLFSRVAQDDAGTPILAKELDEKLKAA